MLLKQTFIQSSDSFSSLGELSHPLQLQGHGSNTCGQYKIMEEFLDRGQGILLWTRKDMDQGSKQDKIKSREAMMK